MLHAWVVFVATAAVLAAGHGFLLRAIAPSVVSGVLVLPAGFAALAAVLQVPTGIPPLAPVATPLAVVLGVAGLMLGLRRRPGSLDAPALAAVLAAFFVLGGPVLASGEATFPGYTLQGDTTVHLLGADALPTYGRDFDELPESAYRGKLESYFGTTAYPSGGPVVLGVLSRLVSIDPAWVFGPLVVLLAAGMALSSTSLLRHFGVGRWTSALGGFLTAQPALFYAYVQTAQIKEVGAASSILLTAALAARWLEARPSWREAVPMGVSAAAAVAFVGPVAAAWLAPMLLGVAGLAALRHRIRLVVLPALVVGAVAAVLSFQTLLGLSTYVTVAGGVLSNAEDFGNLLRPLSLWQVVGIWLQGEWRIDPEGAGNLYWTGVGLGVASLAAVIGIIALVRDRRWFGIALVVMALLAAVVLLRRGSAYADAKVLAITSPWVMLMAVIGVASVLRAPRRAEATVIGAALTIFVLVGNVFAYHDSNLAPRDRLGELQRIGEQLAGEGPTLYVDWDETTSHFLRDATPDSPNEPFAPRRPRINDRASDVLVGAVPRVSVRGAPGESADPDLLGDRYLALYEHMVIRRRPTNSRPSAMFERTSRGRFYDVWTRRPARSDALVAHLPVGGRDEPIGSPRCPVVRRMAAEASTLVAAVRPRPVVARAVPGERSDNWAPTGDGGLRVREAGDITRTVWVPRTGTYDVWVRGSFGRRLNVAIDGQLVGAAAHHLNFAGVELRVARVPLEAGRHSIMVWSGASSYRPGDGGFVRRLDSVILASGGWGTLETVPAARWRSLCDRRDLDWIEAYR